MIDLQSFCGDPEWRTEIAAPWQRDGVVYATNGALLIALDVRAFPEFRGIPDNPRAPDARALLEKNNDVFPLPPVSCPPLPELPPSPPEELITCPHCHGRGKEECYHHDVACEYCNGDGKVIEPAARVEIEINGELFDVKYLRMIKNNFPEFTISARSPLYGIQQPATLMFHGGQGLLMPIRKERIYD